MKRCRDCKYNRKKWTCCYYVRLGQDKDNIKCRDYKRKWYIKIRDFFHRPDKERK